MQQTQRIQLTLTKGPDLKKIHAFQTITDAGLTYLTRISKLQGETLYLYPLNDPPDLSNPHGPAHFMAIALSGVAIELHADISVVGQTNMNK